jgi:hypothetical protein
MKALLPLTIIATLCAGTAYAACTAPDAIAKIPNGSKATKDEMVAAQRSVKAYDAAVKGFTDCLKTEQDAEIAAGGDKMTDEQKAKIAGRYAAKQNTEVDKLQKAADRFNIELKAFKAKNPS